jgi:hypothetical protein
MPKRDIRRVERSNGNSELPRSSDGETKRNAWTGIHSQFHGEE